MGTAHRRSEKEPPIAVKGCFEIKDSKSETIVKMIFQSGNLNRTRTQQIDSGGGGGGYTGGKGTVLDCVPELEVAGDILRIDHRNGEFD